MLYGFQSSKSAYFPSVPPCAYMRMRLRGMELSPPEFEVLGADCVHASRNAHAAVLDMPTTAAVFMKSRRDTLPCTYQCFSSSCLSIVASLVPAVGQ